MARPVKGEMIVRGALLVWVLVVTLVLLLVFPTAQAWPALLSAVVFFLLGNDPARIPQIFVGGATGLVLAALFGLGLGALVPAIGVGPALAACFAVVLTLIIVGGAWAPMALNNVTFAYLTVATISIATMGEHLLGWAAMLLFGGGVLVGGCALLMKALLAAGEKKDEGGAPPASARSEGARR